MASHRRCEEPLGGEAIQPFPVAFWTAASLRSSQRRLKGLSLSNPRSVGVFG
jgi:hypothetical protein